MNRINWFKTETGKKFILGSVAFGTFTAVSFTYFPNTIFIHKYQEIVQSYSEGLPRETSERVLKCFERATQMLNVSEQTKKLLKPFTVIGSDLFNAGTTLSKYGAIIGIPVNFGYINEDSIDKREILVSNNYFENLYRRQQVRAEPINWDTEAGNKLANALVLTEDEKVFGIAREILTAQTAKKLLYIIYPPAMAFLCYVTTTYTNRKLNLFARPIHLRGVMYTLAGLYWYGVYCFAKDFTEVYYEESVDKELANLSLQVAQTGVSFYDKILQRNMALRTFLGDDSFTAYGNENFLIRQKRLPLTYRKEYFEKRCKEYTTEVEEKVDE